MRPQKAMTITTQRTKYGKYIVTAEQDRAAFMASSSDRRTAFSKAVEACYKYTILKAS